MAKSDKSARNPKPAPQAPAAKPPAAKGKPAPRPAQTAKKPPTPAPPADTPRPPAAPAVAGLDAAASAVHKMAEDLTRLAEDVRGTAKELRALRSERDAVRAELDGLRDQIRAVTKEAADGLAGLERLRVEAEAAVAHVADLKHVCREAGEELRSEVGEDSVVLVRLRQTREQADEAVREAAGAGDRIRAFREECERAAKAADVLHLQARAAYLESLNEVLKGVARVKGEVGELEDRLADLGRRADRPPPPLPEAGNRLGVVVDHGVVVAEVLPNGQAASAGLARGDVIEAVNGRSIFSAAGLRDAILDLPEGADLNMRVRRGETPMLMAGRLDSADKNGNRLGVVVAPGVVVAGVTPDSPAATAGLSRGDVIERAAGQEIHSGEDLKAAVLTLPHGSDVALAVARGGTVREVVVRLAPSNGEPPPGEGGGGLGEPGA